MIPVVPLIRAGAMVVLGIADVIARAMDRRQARRREGAESVTIPVIPIDPVAEATVEAYIREHGRRACPACDGRPATSCPVCGVVA